MNGKIHYHIFFYIRENAADCFLELNTDMYITYLKLKMDVLLTMAGHFRMDRDPTSLSALSVISYILSSLTSTATLCLEIQVKFNMCKK